MLTFVIVTGAAVVLALSVGWVLGHLVSAMPGATAPPRLERMEKVSEALTKGIALLSALLAILATRDGGLGRLQANGGRAFTAAVVLVTLSVLCALASWIAVATAPERGVTGLWLGIAVLSVTLFGASVVGLLQANKTVSDLRDRPTVTAERTEAGLTFSASIDLLSATQFMRATVHGYPADGGPRELLFNTTTGPDAEGRAETNGAIRQDLSRYEVVEVRAFRGSEDPGCERGIEGAEGVGGADFPTESGPAACASVWIVPLVQG